MNQVVNLFRLQQVDSQADRVRVRLEAIRAALENDAQLEEARRALSAADTELGTARAKLRDAEQAVEAQRTKLEHAESSLYAGGVQNPKELQDLQNDVASLKRHLAALEDEQLAGMLALESAQAVEQEAAVRLETVQERLSAQNQGLDEERAALLKSADRLEVERQAVREGIAGSELNLYEQLRQHRKGVAVAAVADNACAACGTPLTPAQQQEARSSPTFARCSGCSRILYVA